MRIAIFNVKYSPNLGDGLLSECLEEELSTYLSSIVLVTLDLAGRHFYGPSARGRQLTLRLLEHMPPSFRRIVTRAALLRLSRRQLTPDWMKALRECDAVIIGGGNLFADADLNFPVKVNCALRVASHYKLPVAVYGVGVSDNWSLTGKRLFEEGLTGADIIDVAVRDARSRMIWDKLLPKVRPSIIREVRDPGLLASIYYPAESGDLLPSGIGFCITDPLALRYHSPDGTILDDLGSWYGEAIADLSSAGNRIFLFTNGSPEDESFLAFHTARWTSLPGVSVVSRFNRPGKLARFIARCELIVAHRMHACIAAYSYGIPTVGLIWDRKLQSFFESVGRSEWVIDPALVRPTEMSGLASKALEEGVDRVRVDQVIAECRADIARLALTLMDAKVRHD